MICILVFILLFVTCGYGLGYCEGQRKARADMLLDKIENKPKKRLTKGPSF